MAGLLVHKAENYSRNEVVMALFVAVVYGFAAGILIGFVIGHIER